MEVEVPLGVTHANSGSGIDFSEWQCYWLDVEEEID